MKRAKQSNALTSLSLPVIDYVGKDARAVALLAARLCLLPDKKTVRQFKKAVFPTKRKTTSRGKRIRKGKGMWDDNTTPRWALLWSHGVHGGNDVLRGWHVAHVWSNCNELECYTRLENLLLVPAAYAGLTDGDGPLAPYLRYHAFKVYRWRPKGKPAPKKPLEYEKFRKLWRYLRAERGNARKLVLDRLQQGRGRRAEVLRKFIDSISYWGQPRGRT